MTTFISGSQSVVLRLPTASAPPGKLVRNENSNLVNQTLGVGPSDLSLNKLPQGDGCKVKFGHRCLGLRAAQGSFREETYSQKVEISGPRRHGWLPWRMNRGSALRELGRTWGGGNPITPYTESIGDWQDWISAESTVLLQVLQRKWVGVGVSENMRLP